MRINLSNISNKLTTSIKSVNILLVSSIVIGSLTSFFIAHSLLNGESNLAKREVSNEEVLSTESTEEAQVQEQEEVVSVETQIDEINVLMADDLNRNADYLSHPKSLKSTTTTEETSSMETKPTLPTITLENNTVETNIYLEQMLTTAETSLEFSLRTPQTTPTTTVPPTTTTTTVPPTTTTTTVAPTTTTTQATAETAAAAAAANTANDGYVYLDGLRRMTQEEYRVYKIARDNWQIGRYWVKNNWYAAGWCTWYVYNARIRVGRYIPNNLGDARNWAWNAANQGYNVNYYPSVGAVAVNASGNHVMFVEKVYANGSILVSEGGSNWTAYTFNTRVVPAWKAAQYQYIH